MTETAIEQESRADTAGRAPDDEARFMLNSPIDIGAVLRDIVRTRTLVTVHFDSAQETLLTPLLDVDAASGQFVFDCSGSENINRGVQQARKLLFYGTQDKVKIRFSTGPARCIDRQGRPAFQVTFPQSMLRLQRREFYRVLTPVARPVICVLPVGTDSGSRTVETRLHDISQGGVALIANPGDIPNELHSRYPNSRIALPDVGNVVVTLETVSVQDMVLLNAKTVMRIGCQFVRPSMSALALVQRYMMKLEREKRARE